MNRLQLRERIGNRTYEAGKRLLMDGRVSVENRIDGRLCVYRVKDGQSRHVVVWNRNGRISVECECTSEEMGCRHCACVYMSLLSDQGDDRKFIDDVRRSIEELSDISFNPLDYLGETTEKTIMTSSTTSSRRR